MARALALALERAEDQYIANEMLLLSLIPKSQETKKGISWEIDDFGKIFRDNRALEKQKYTFTMVHSDGMKLHWDIEFQLVNIEPNMPSYYRDSYNGDQVLTHFGGKTLLLCMGLKKKGNGPSSVVGDIYVTLEGYNKRSLFWSHSENKVTLIVGDVRKWPVCHAHCASKFPIGRSNLTMTIFVRIFETHNESPREMLFRQRLSAPRNRNIHTLASYPEISNQPQPQPQHDVILESCDGQKFRAHKSILRVASDVLKEKIDKQNLPVAEILFTTVPGKALQILLKFIYTKQVMNEWAGNDIIHEVVDAGVMFKIRGFQEFLNAALQIICTVENSPKLLRLANHYNLKKAEADIAEYVRCYEESLEGIENWH